MIEDWERRYTVRCFDDKQTIPDEDVNHLKKFFKHVPSQQSLVNNIWFTLTNEHMEFRIWLLENIFHFVHQITCTGGTTHKRIERTMVKNVRSHLSRLFF